MFGVSGRCSTPSCATTSRIPGTRQRSWRSSEAGGGPGRLTSSRPTHPMCWYPWCRRPSRWTRHGDPLPSSSRLRKTVFPGMSPRPRRPRSSRAATPRARRSGAAGVRGTGPRGFRARRTSQRTLCFSPGRPRHVFTAVGVQGQRQRRLHHSGALRRLRNTVCSWRRYLRKVRHFTLGGRHGTVYPRTDSGGWRNHAYERAGCLDRGRRWDQLSCIHQGRSAAIPGSWQTRALVCVGQRQGRIRLIARLCGTSMGCASRHRYCHKRPQRCNNLQVQRCGMLRSSHQKALGGRCGRAGGAMDGPVQDDRPRTGVCASDPGPARYPALPPLRSALPPLAAGAKMRDPGALRWPRSRPPSSRRRGSTGSGRSIPHQRWLLHRGPPV